MNPRGLSLRPKTTLKSRFTNGFLHALKRLNRQRSSSPNVCSPREMCRRYLSVKIAADATMASAVGTKRAWSRALLMKIRSSHRGLAAVAAPRVLIKKSSRRILDNGMKEKTKKKKKKKERMKKRDDHEDNMSVVCEANELRKFVPGGGAMDVCSLLDEAAHYIKCLNTQVKVMRQIADVYSAV